MRKPMVTRTITTTEVELLCVDIEKSETFVKTVTLPRTYKDDNAILKRITEGGVLDNLKPVHVINAITHEILYGMTEDEFINSAKVLPPRGTAEVIAISSYQGEA